MRDGLHGINWHCVLDDLAYLGLTGDELAERTGLRVGLRVGLQQRVATGSVTPAPAVRQRLADLWCHLTSKAPGFLPLAPAAGGEGGPIPGLDSNEPQADTFAELQRITAEWAAGAAPVSE